MDTQPDAAPPVPVGPFVRAQILVRLREALAIARDDLDGELDRFRTLLANVLEHVDGAALPAAVAAGRNPGPLSSRLKVTALSSAQGEPVGEFLLIPFGDVAVERPVAGESFVFTATHAESARRWFQQMGRKLAIDYEHQTFDRLNTRPDGLRPAAGWIGSLDVRDDGLWATDVTWTERAAELLRAGEYRYFSPVIFWTDEDHTDVSALGPVALTNDPAMHGVRPLAASRQPSESPDEESAEPEPTIASVLVAQAELDAAQAEIECLRKQLRMEEADAFVERGLRLGEDPRQHEHGLAGGLPARFGGDRSASGPRAAAVASGPRVDPRPARRGHPRAAGPGRRAARPGGGRPTRDRAGGSGSLRAGGGGGPRAVRGPVVTSDKETGSGKEQTGEPIMALTVDRNVEFYASEELVDFPVKDNVKIYKGGFVWRDRATGYEHPLAAGDEYLGLAYRQADNTASGHAAGGINARLHQSVDIVHALSGVTLGDVGKDVYASDDETLTLTPTGNSRVGRIVAVENTNLARVRCRPVMALCGLLDNAPVVSLADASATLTLDHMNRTLLIANSVARTLTLPPVATVRAGGWFRIVKASAAAAAVTLDGNASETIDGGATFAAIDAQYDTALVLCTGSEWIILSRDIA